MVFVSRPHHPGLPVLVSAMEVKMDLDRELREFVKPYGVHFGLQNDPGLPGAIVDLVSVFLYNNNLAPTDDELIHMSTVATMQFAKSWKKGHKRRLDR